MLVYDIGADCVGSVVPFCTVAGSATAYPDQFELTVGTTSRPAAATVPAAAAATAAASTHANAKAVRLIARQSSTEFSTPGKNDRVELSCNL
jgi:hypothetical protein